MEENKENKSIPQKIEDENLANVSGGYGEHVTKCPNCNSVNITGSGFGPYFCDDCHYGWFDYS